MTALSLPLKAAIGLLMVVSIIELAFVSSMVGWLHLTASKGFNFFYNGAAYPLAGEPANFLVDQGHTSNGAAGTAFIIIGLGGFLALWIRNRSRSRERNSSLFIYYLWLALQIPAFLLTVGALVYVFVVTTARQGQTIDLALAATLNGKAYTANSWTPQNWFSAVLQLHLVDASADIQTHLMLMRGWQYNLIPFAVIQLIETVLALLDFSQWRKDGYMKGRSHV
jgi:hypothetical protein